VSVETVSDRQLRRRLVVAAGLPVVVMFVWVVILLWQISQLSETGQWVDHTDQVLSQVHRAEADAAQRSADVRAFLLTRSPELLADLSTRQANLTFETLAQLTSDNPPQQARVQAAEEMYERWWSVAQAEIAMLRAGQDPAELVRTQAVPAERALRQRLDQIRSV